MSERNATGKGTHIVGTCAPDEISGVRFAWIEPEKREAARRAHFRNLVKRAEGQEATAPNANAAVLTSSANVVKDPAKLPKGFEVQTPLEGRDCEIFVYERPAVDTEGRSCHEMEIEVIANSHRDGDIEVIVPKGVSATVIRNGVGKGHCFVLGSGNGNAVRIGGGEGQARREGPGPGNAWRLGSGLGHAARTGDGDGDAQRDGTGRGGAYRSGNGQGDAMRGGSGDGNAERWGSGMGDALHFGPGDGNAARYGDGDGDAWREGAGTGGALRAGQGTGNALREGEGDAVRRRGGEGKALRAVEGKWVAARPVSGDGEEMYNRNGPPGYIFTTVMETGEARVFSDPGDEFLADEEEEEISPQAPAP